MRFSGKMLRQSGNIVNVVKNLLVCCGFGSGGGNGKVIEGKVMGSAAQLSNSNTTVVV